MKLLTISCHPDDIEIGAGGTINKCVKRGDEVTICHLTNGSLGHMVIMPEELRKIRIKEAYEGGKILGAKEVICLDVNDIEVDSYDEGVVTALVEVIRHVRPDFIITHSPDDYMKDHCETSKMAYDASFTATLAHYANTTYMKDKPYKMRKPVFNGEYDKEPPIEMGTMPFTNFFPPIYYMDTLAGVNFNPEIYVDISNEIDTKIAALECHDSQLRWMREHDHIDFAEMVKTCSKYRGYQCSRDYAEGFVSCKVYPRVPVSGLLP